MARVICLGLNHNGQEYLELEHQSFGTLVAVRVGGRWIFNGYADVRPETKAHVQGVFDEAFHKISKTFFKDKVCSAHGTRTTKGICLDCEGVE